MALRLKLGLLVVVVCGCVDIGLDFGPLAPIGLPFIVSGTADVIDNGGSCLIWRGQNGVTYHLFQSLAVSNEGFDKITTPGVTSRLLLLPREDLVVACQVGTIVEVEDFLEVVE